MNATQYAEARKMYDEYYTATRKWLDENHTNGLPIEVAKTLPHYGKVNNELASALEVYEFTHDAPEYYTLYINEDKRIATTWMGEKLGDITAMGQPYRDNFGGTRVAITVRGINGKLYHGTYYRSSGDYARIRQYKNQETN